MNIGKLLQEELPVQDKNDKIQFDGISDFIKPVNEIFQKVLKEATLQNPQTLSELLTIDMSDLMRVFRSVFAETDDIEAAYRQVMKGVEELGAKKFVEQFSDIEVNESDSLEKGYLQKLDKIIKNMMSNPEVFSKMDNSQLHYLVKEYLSQVMILYYLSPSTIIVVTWLLMIIVFTLFFRLNPVLNPQRGKTQSKVQLIVPSYGDHQIFQS